MKYTNQEQTPHAADETISVLLVEDNPGDARLFRHHINTDINPAYPTANVTHVESMETAIQQLTTASFDIVLLDLGLPKSSGVDTLEQFTEQLATHDDIEPTPIVVLTGLEDDETALEAIERGAQDYLVKDDVNRKILNRTIRYAIERHTQEQKLRREKNRFEEFANVVSHDLRNPLNVAKGHVNTIDHDGLAPVARNLDRMEVIINEMLTLARTGQEVTDVEPVHLGTLAERCWNQVPTAEATLSIEDSVVLNADSRRLEQMLENLFRNSVEHAGESVELRVAGTEDGFVIADDGPGIPESERDRVFDAGYTTARDGTGFGLNIVQAVVEAHDWNIAIAESERGGARFEISDVDLAE